MAIKLHICVAGKVATYQKRDGVIVCGNEDYQIEFSFDEAWDAYEKKTARFIWNDTFMDVDIDDGVCFVPKLKNTTLVEVGVFAGDYATTTSASIPALTSVLCKSATPSVENDKHYANEAKEAAERAAEDARAEVIRLVGEIGVVQTMGDSPTAVMSQKSTTGYLSQHDKRITRNDKRITNLEQGLPDDNFMVDETVAYNKDVPTNALPFAEVNKIGGMSYKTRNLLKPFQESNSSWNGYNITRYTDGSVEITGAANKEFEFVVDLADLANYPARMRAGEQYTLTVTKDGQPITTGRRITYQDAAGGTYWGFPGDTTRERALTKLYVQSNTTVGDSSVCGVYKAILTKGTEAIPYEPYFDGLKATNVTKLVSVGTNLIPYPYVDGTKKTIGGVTFTVNDDGSIHAKGTATSDANFFLCLDKKFAEASAYADNSVITRDGVTFQDVSYLVNQSSGNFATYVGVTNGATVDKTFYPMIHKLSTALPYQPYVYRTLDIPEEVQALDGYGLGANASVYNYIDLEKKQFVKRVACVDLGTLTWTRASTVSGGVRFQGNIAATPVPSEGKNIPNIICSKYNAVSTTDTWNDIDGITTRSTSIEIKDNNYTDGNTLKSALSGEMLVYELAEPIITDISNLITSDNFIGVEGGGTLTFENEYGYAVPSTIEYQLEV